jgi:uncharacterized lipoprotein NlpE involved in copper resistance
MSFLKRRKRFVLLGVAALVALAGIAYGFIAVSGSGTGTAGTASATSDALTLTSSQDKALTFVGDSNTLTVHASNPNKSPVNSGHVTVTVTPTAAAGKTCPAGSFTVNSTGLNTATVASTTQVPGGDGTTPGEADLAPTFTIHYTNVSSPQNDCTGYSVALSSTAS